MTEGWGGDARKVHYCRDGKAICGRVPADFDPKIDDCYDPAYGTQDFCRLCLKRMGIVPVTTVEISRRVTW